MASPSVRTCCTEKLFKVVVIGDVGVGKSSVICRYVHNSFKETYKTSIGVDFALKTIEWDRNTVVRLQLWDIAGQERCKNLSRVYYKEAMGALVVFDIAKRSTFESALEWKQGLDSKIVLDSGSTIPAVLLANKCDTKEGDREILPTTLDQFSKENNFIGWFETSAKDNINIDEAGAFLVENILRCDKDLSNEETHGDSFKVKAPGAIQSNRLACCWGQRF